jgi:protein-tyrosine phosphatase
MTENNQLRLEGAANFRDIGGSITTDGRRVKRAHIFRSGELSQLTDADLDLLRRLEIGCIVDLRSLKECELHRSRLPADLKSKLHQADITLDIRLDGKPIIDMIKEDPSPEGVARAVAKGFPVIADLCGPTLKLIADRLAGGGAPVIFHCTNGRDRTGVISAMLLYLLGAPRDAIVADFMTTNERIDVERVIANTLDTYRKGLGMELTRESIEIATLVRAEYIDALFQGFDSRYGSAEGYLAHFGINPDLRERLRERLLEPV